MIALALALAGCAKPGPSELSTDEDVQALGELPGLRKTADARLLEELARIEQQGGTARLLCREVPDKENVWKGLERLILPDFRDSNLEKTSEIFNRLYYRPRDLKPRDSGPRDYGRYLVINLRVLAEATGFREEKQKQQVAADEALERQQCDFGLDPMMGVLNDLSFIDTVRVLAHLEAFLAADFLALGEVMSDLSPGEESPAAENLDKTPRQYAIDSVGIMLRLAHLLAQQKHVTTRLSGAAVREDALVVTRAIVDHPLTTRDDLEKLYELIEKQLSTWPADADVWIGDRAMGMHSYELVRAGHFYLLVGEEQLAAFKQEGISAELPVAVIDHADEDELYYLQTMRKIITVLQELPAKRTAASFQARQKVLADMQQELKRRRYDVQTLVACRVLLPGMRLVVTRLAEDRAACELWALALAEALGRSRPQLVPRINPIDGSEYMIRTETDGRQAVVVAWHTGKGIGGASQPVLVPIRGAAVTGE